jgi:hypothetical protein
MKNQENGTILSLPLHQNTGWQYYSWGYQGSGFIWFNLPQAVTDRDFDRWQPKNEQLYKDFFSSLYANNLPEFQKLLKKYNISYLLWDQNQVNTQIKNQDQIIFKHEISSLLDQLSDQNQIKFLKSFDNLYLYQVSSDFSLVQIQNQTDYKQNNLDFYNQILNPQNRIDTSILNINPQTWLMNYQGQSYQLSPQAISEPNISHFLDIPHPQAYIIAIQSQYRSGIPIRICLKNNYSKICTFEDQLSTFKTPDWDFFFIRPQDDFFGYNLEINKINPNYQKVDSQILQSFVVPIPNDLLHQLNSPTKNYQAQNINSKTIFPNNSFVKIYAPPSQNSDSYLVFNQSYTPSWLTFYFSSLRPIFLKDHALANNWANSWSLPQNLPQNTIIYILFWPQLLEFLGFALLIPTLIYILKKKP